jgi:heptosyltransferase-1
MQRVLIVKTSSLGDMVHALPAITDLLRAYPQCTVDWLAEESFADLPCLHPGVARVIPCAVRRWRARPLARATWMELGALRARLRETSYDVILDLQGLFKSACLARLARGPRHGYGLLSIREPLASFSYDARHRVSWRLPAVERNRRLTASACAYAMEGPADYGLELPRTAPDRPTVVCLHGTSRDDKLWPEASWHSLLAHFDSVGLRVLLPWGSEAERGRSLRLAQSCVGAEVPERLSIAELAQVCASAIGVVGVDTGPSHLAAAVGVPVIALYAGSDPALTGVMGGRAPALNLGGRDMAPTAGEVIAATHAVFGV